jgi:hypothetical protein
MITCALVQVDVQSNEQLRTSRLDGVQPAKVLLAGLPIGPLSHLHQLLPGVENVFEVGYWQIPLRCLAIIPWNHEVFYRFLGETGRSAQDTMLRN